MEGTGTDTRAGMVEAMAEEGTVEENMVEVTVEENMVEVTAEENMVGVTAEEGVGEATAEEGTKEGTAEVREEGTAEVDTGVELTGVVKPFIMVAAKAAWFTMATAKPTQSLRQQTPRLMPLSSLPILKLSCGLVYLLQQTQP